MVSAVSLTDIMYYWPLKLPGLKSISNSTPVLVRWYQQYQKQKSCTNDMVSTIWVTVILYYSDMVYGI